MTTIFFARAESETIYNDDDYFESPVTNSSISTVTKIASSASCFSSNSYLIKLTLFFIIFKLFKLD